jgi:hypothetical protein
VDITGSEEGYTCNSVGERSMTEVVTWKTTVGNCRRVDQASITLVIPEGEVANSAKC